MAVQWRATKWDSGDCYDGGQYTSIGNPSRQSMYEIAVYNNCSNLLCIAFCTLLKVTLYALCVFR